MFYNVLKFLILSFFYQSKTAFMCSQVWQVSHAIYLMTPQNHTVQNEL